MENELNQILKDTVESQGKTIRHLKQIIIVLIISWLLSICFGFGAFVWYESQFEYEVVTEETTTDVQLDSSGENANAEYNDVEGNQYNDGSTHKEGDK